MPCPQKNKKCTDETPCIACRMLAKGDSEIGKTKLKRSNSVERIMQAAAAKKAGPADFSGAFAFRGEDGETRNPAGIKSAGGIKPWQAATVEAARENLQKLVSKADPKGKGLKTIAMLWQGDKAREDGFFFSTGLTQKGAYDTAKYFYMMDIGKLVKRDWAAVGLTNIDNAVIDKCVLYTDKATVAESNMIAILCMGLGADRSYELLIMTPFPLKKTSSFDVSTQAATPL